MTDIFISYASEDREAARRLAAALAAEGWGVWWDRQIPAGESFESFIEARLNEASCVIVFWSKASVDSLWVRAEASEALKQRKLVPILIEATEPPLVFRQIQTADLTGWEGNRKAPAYLRLVADVTGLIGARKPPEATAPESPKVEPTEEREAVGDHPVGDGATTRSRRPLVTAAVVLLVVAGAALGAYFAATPPSEPPRIVSFEAEPAEVLRGQTSELSWTTEGAKKVTLRSHSEKETNVALVGRRQVRPDASTLYTLVAENSAGRSEVTEMVSVVEPEPAHIISFDSNRPRIAPGESALLSWQTEGAVTVELKPIGTVEASGSRKVTPETTTNYVLVVTGADGKTASETRTITVRAPPVARITSFKPDTPKIDRGDKTVLRWQTENAVRVELDGVAVKADSSKTVAPRKTTRYRLTAWNAAGRVTEGEATIEVTTPVTPQVLQLVVAGGGRPLNDARVRNALAHAVPWDDLLAKIFSEKATTLFDMPFEAGRPSPVKSAYDPKAARRLLAEAGYPDGLSVYLYVDNDKMTDIGKFVADHLARAGIKADLAVVPRDAALKRVQVSQQKDAKIPVLFLDFEKR